MTDHLRYLEERERLTAENRRQMALLLERCHSVRTGVQLGLKKAKESFALLRRTQPPPDLHALISARQDHERAANDQGSQQGQQIDAIIDLAASAAASDRDQAHIVG